MLDGYGIHTLIWDAADERLGDFMVASPADAEGRGLELHVRQGGAAADLTGANVYFLWRHGKTGRRGCGPFATIDASLGQLSVYYPAAMQEEGPVGLGLWRQDAVARDQIGRRWRGCELCGRVDAEDEFTTMGGAGRINLGKCRSCMMGG